ncbi:MAG: hypothetical protein Q9208_003356 [Pyrenodesmia sp. 3 TL-2023]
MEHPHGSSFTLSSAHRTESNDSFVTAPTSVVSDASDSNEHSQDFLLVPLLPELHDVDFPEPEGSSDMVIDHESDEDSDASSVAYSLPSSINEEERDYILSNDALLHIVYEPEEDLSSSSDDDDDDGDDSSMDSETQGSEEELEEGAESDIPASLRAMVLEWLRMASRVLGA